ncbi:MAG: hypothetical protein AAF752_13165 [Bacteroidota bacterium]
MLVAFLVPVAVVAQRPYQTDDPLYRDEAALRDFFEGVAVTGEVLYVPAGAITNAGIALPDGSFQAPPIASPSGPVGLSFLIEYALMPRLDVNAVIDASGGLRGQSAALSWVALRHYWTSGSSNFALRLAFDPRPAIDGRLGFRQTDLGIFYNSALSPMVSLDLIAGFRQVRSGYQRLQAVGLPSASALEVSDPSIYVTRTDGLEAHITMQYNMHFDLAGSHAFAALEYEGGDYTLSEHPLARPDDMVGPERDYLGHVIWLRTGFRLHRPSYRIAPFLSIPLASSARGRNLLVTDQPQGKGPKLIRLGMRLTLR